MILTSRKTYTVGDAVRTTAKFRKDKVLIDPTVVEFGFHSPSGITTAYVYGDDANITKTSTGVYVCTFEVDEPGTWYYKWMCDGNATGAAERRIIVRETKF